jgi:hypothetical protein
MDPYIHSPIRLHDSDQLDKYKENFTCLPITEALWERDAEMNLHTKGSINTRLQDLV